MRYKLLLMSILKTIILLGSTDSVNGKEDSDEAEIFGAENENCNDINQSNYD